MARLKKRPQQRSSPQRGGSVLSPSSIYQLCRNVGGWNEEESIIATAIVLAESGGNWGKDSYNGVCCWGGWQIHEVHKLTVAQMLDPIKSTRFARSLYNGRLQREGVSNRWNDWEVYTLPRTDPRSYVHHLGTARQASKVGGGGVGADGWATTGGGGSNNGNGSPTYATIGGVVGDSPQIPGDDSNPDFSGAGIAGLIANAIAKESAKWFVASFMWVGKILYDEVAHPTWEHTQRAVVYYYDEIMTGKEKGVLVPSYAGVVTLFFWSLGWAILWRDGDDLSEVAKSPDRTAIGRVVTKAQQTAQQRKLIKPKDVKKETPKKPTPKKSAAPIEVTRYARVARKRSVSVRFGKDGVSYQKESEETPQEDGRLEEGRVSA